MSDKEIKDREHAAWSRKNWEFTKVGGSWAVPRSGLIFNKTTAGYELATVMSYTPDIAFAAYLHADVPQNAKELRDYQRKDFNIIKYYHDLAGLDVTDPRGILSD